jgi:hypothetical protein
MAEGEDTAVFGAHDGLRLSMSVPEAFLSNGMDQQEADDKHHRAGYAMN